MGQEAEARPAGNERAPSVADELRGKYLDEIEIGQTAIYTKTVTDADIVLFAGISGDTNPLHMNSEFAGGTRFEGRVAHGMITASFISACIGTKLPGPGCIYMSQTIRWTAPVRPGDTVVARVTITDINYEKERATLDTVCMVGDEVVLEGECTVKVPARPPQD